MAFEFTEKEKIAANSAKKKMLEDNPSFTLDELEALVKFERHAAIRDEEREKKTLLMEQETEAKLEEMRKTEQAAQEALKAQADIARKKLIKLGLVEDEQQK